MLGGKRVYLYTLKERVDFQLDLKPSEDIELADNEGNTMITFKTDGKLSLYPGYAWDGASPKFSFGPLMMGTWDGNWDHDTDTFQLREATLVHDSLIQCKYYAKDKTDNIKQKEIDKLFRSYMQKVDFKFTGFYYVMVRFYHYVVRTPRNWFR